MTDSIHWRIQPIDPWRGASSRRSGRIRCMPYPALTSSSNSRPAKPLSPMWVSPGRSAPVAAAREQTRRHLALADLGGGQAPGGGHPVRGGDQVQLQAPVPARMRRAKPIAGPSGQLGPFDGLPGSTARHRGRCRCWLGRAVVMAGVVTVPELLDGHTALDVECLDRIYLNGHVPALQVGGQVVAFLHDHLGMRIPSPAVLEQIGTRSARLWAGSRRSMTSRWSSSPRVRGRSMWSGRCCSVLPGLARRRWQRSAGRRNSSRCGPRASGALTRPGPAVLVRHDPAPGDLLLLLSASICTMRTSGRRSSRSALTSRIRSRSGSTGTSGPTGSWPGSGSASPNCPTGSRPARTRLEQLSRPVDQDRLGCFGLGLLSGSFDDFAVDEGCSGADQGDEVGCVDGAPAVLC